MLWKEELNARLDALGPFPTPRQAEDLQAWFVRNVPKVYWEDVIYWLPANMGNEIMEKAKP